MVLLPPPALAVPSFLTLRATSSAAAEIGSLSYLLLISFRDRRRVYPCLPSTTLATTVAMLLAAGAANLIHKVVYNMPRKLWLAWYPAGFAVIAALFSAIDIV